jgi:hypothetical protein
VGRSNAVESPLPPDARRSRKRWFVSTAVPKPANIRIVQSFERYIEAYGPRVYGHSPGSSASGGPYTGSSGRPERVSKSASRVGAASYAACQRSLPSLT